MLFRSCLNRSLLFINLSVNLIQIPKLEELLSDLGSSAKTDRRVQKDIALEHQISFVIILYNMLGCVYVPEHRNKNFNFLKIYCKDKIDKCGLTRGMPQSRIFLLISSNQSLK